MPEMRELGSTGLEVYGGLIYEDFLPNLRGPRARAIYTEMYYNDPVIGAIFYAAEQLIRRVTWRVEPASTSRKDVKAAEFVAECMHDMEQTWDDLIAEAFTMLPYGWSWHEIVYKKRDGDQKDKSRRSKYTDNLIGWRKIPGRAQSSLHRWIMDDAGDILGMEQDSPTSGKIVKIPLEKSLHFRTTTVKNNPEGRSMLRNAYRPWYFKKRIEELEGIGIERDLAGLPVLTAPEGVDIWQTDDPVMAKMLDNARQVVRNIRRDREEGIVLPFEWKLELLASSGKRQFDTNATINRYDQRIAITMLTDIVMLGADKVGSFALANVKKSMLIAALESHLGSITDIINKQAVPKLMQYNPFGVEKCPKICHGMIDDVNLKDLAEYIKKLADSKMPLFPDEGLEEYLREVARLPKKSGNPKAAEETKPKEDEQEQEEKEDGEEN